MIFKGSFSQCVINAATTFRTCADTHLAICRNTRAKYYVVLTAKEFEETDFESPNCHISPVFLGSERELLVLARPVVQHEIDFTRLDDPTVH